MSDFIARFAGDDRYIVDYLVEEVLQHQSVAVREFLLQTSTLDRLTGPLCDALTGRDGRRRVDRDQVRPPAVAAPRILTLLRIHDHRVRGFAIGMASHGIGTSRAFHDNPLGGAFSGLAMALNALATAIALPLFLTITPW